MPRCRYTWLLFAVLLALPSAVAAQTRFLERGHWGISASLDYLPEADKINDFDWGARAALTCGGLFDIGAGFRKEREDQAFADFPKTLFADVVLIDPRARTGTGLEIGGSYTEQTFDGYPVRIGLADPIPTRFVFRTYRTSLRYYYRKSWDRKTGLILSLAGLYRFHKRQLRDLSDEVLQGRDFGEFGLALGCELRFVGLMFCAAGGEYGQDKRYVDREEWDFSWAFRAGIVFDLNPGRDGGSHAP